MNRPEPAWCRLERGLDAGRPLEDDPLWDELLEDPIAAAEVDTWMVLRVLEAEFRARADP